MSVRTRWTILLLAASAAVLVMAVIIGTVVVRTDWFHDQVRERIVAETERATGGQAQVGRFTFDWRQLRAELHDFELRGAEPRDSEPLFHADRIAVGLKIVSMLKRDVDVALIEIDRPSFVIRRLEEGGTNLPRREGGGNRDIMGTIVKLAVREFRVRDGRWRYDRESGKLDFAGRSLSADVRHNPSIPGYDADLEWEQLVVRAPEEVPLAMSGEVSLSIRRDRLEVRRGRFSSEQSSAEVTGTITDISPFTGNLDVQARMSIADVVYIRRLPIESTGEADFKGVLEWSPQFHLEGEAQATGLAYHGKYARLDDIDAKASVEATSELIEVEDLVATMLGGEFNGNATVTGLRRFTAEGHISGVPLKPLLPRVRVNRFPWNGTVAGPVRVGGAFAGPVAGEGQLRIVERSGGLPLEGSINASFDTAEPSDVNFDDSLLVTGSSRINFSGSLRNGLRVGVYTEDAGELLPAAAIWDAEVPDPFPVQLEDGVAQFGGLLTGILDGLSISGHVAAGPLSFSGRVIDDAAADFDISEDQLDLRSVTVQQNGTRLRGDLQIELDGWRARSDSPIRGEFRVADGSLKEILTVAGWERPVDGRTTTTGVVSGAIGQPALAVQTRVQDVTAWGESIESVEAELDYADRTFHVRSGMLRAGGGELRFQGAYSLPRGDTEPASAEFDLEARDFSLSHWQAVRKVNAGLDARIGAKLAGTMDLSGTEPRLTSLAGDVELDDVEFNGRSVGDARLITETNRNVLVARAWASFTDAAIRASAEWSLGRRLAGLGRVRFDNLTIHDLQGLGLFGGPQTEIYVDGSMDGEIAFSGPVLRPADWRGFARINRMSITPTPGNSDSDRDLTLRNSGPLTFSIEPARIRIETARLVSTDTDLTLSGTLSYLRRNPWNLRLLGSIDLAVLTAFRSDLQAEGRSEADVTVRGSLLEPQVNGRLRFQNGSFYLRNLPNGIEQANGVIRFNRTRATIEQFNSRTGGGDLELGGFIGFGSKDWVYRIQANAQRVRIRYPAGVSTVLDATVNLTGTSLRSLLAGEVAVIRSAFDTDSDLGGLLSNSSGVRPPSEIDNAFLRGMQFDIDITTAPNAEFVTSLTRDLEVEADLRLRGSVVRPVLLGRLSVSRGEIQFFGNRYNIVQGEVTFFNPVKIEPILALDLSTRIRSYQVMMNFSGPVDKLSFSYRSDPPLQSEEIIALLTVGRAPGYAGSPTSSGPADESYFQTGGSSFLGHALTAPVSGRLQRFFGVSRIKIDPQLTGVDNTPETHVTIEQQISRDITLTYVTNLTQTQQQIVRLEWNFHPDWSVFAVRDSNGVFGMDFVYRRRFK